MKIPYIILYIIHHIHPKKVSNLGSMGTSITRSSLLYGPCGWAWSQRDGARW